MKTVLYCHGKFLNKAAQNMCLSDLHPKVQILVPGTLTYYWFFIKGLKHKKLCLMFVFLYVFSFILQKPGYPVRAETYGPSFLDCHSEAPKRRCPFIIPSCLPQVLYGTCQSYWQIYTWAVFILSLGWRWEVNILTMYWRWMYM